MDKMLYFFHRKERPMKKNAPRGSHCGGIELCRRSDTPQAENLASKILSYFIGKTASGVLLN